MMMPERFLEWDLNEQQLRDHRKHWRPSSSSETCPFPRQGYGWVVGVAGGGGPIWREFPSHSIPYPYPYHLYHYDPYPRWTSDFRSRAAPTGYGREGTHFYPADGGNRFVQSRPSGRFRGNKRSRASRGKKNSRVSRGRKPSHNKKDTDNSFPEAAPSLNDPERSNDVNDKQKSVDVLLTYSSSPRSNCSHSSDRSQPKELLEKNDGLDTPVDSQLREQHEDKDGLDTPDGSQLKEQHEDNDGLDTPLGSQLKEQHEDNDGLDTPVGSQLKEQHEDNDGLDTPVGSQLKEQHEDNDGLDVPVSSSQTFEKANPFGSIDWRTKWTRPGSLYCRSYSFSHSSSSKSKDVECKEVKMDVQQDETTTLSPHGDSDIPVAAIHPPKPTEAPTVSLEEMGRCKKRRLGWGEGLAKYEKQKIEQTDESASKNDVVVCNNNGEQMHVLASKLTDKCPMVNAFPECASPTTPLAISCGPSPVTEVKQLLTEGNNEHVKANLNLSPVTEQNQSMMDGSILHDKANLSFSSSVADQYHLERRNFKLENADLTPVASLNSAITDLPLSNDSSPVCSDFVTSADINKLLVMKRDVLKTIELIESDIDKIECELKSVSDEENIHDQSSSSNSLPVDCVLEYTLNENAASQVTGQSSSFESVVPHAEEFLAADGNNEDVEAYSLGKHLSSDRENQVQIPLKTDSITYVCRDANTNAADGLVGDNIPYLFASCYGSQLDEQGILASNRDIAIRCAEVLNKLLPANKCSSDISNAIENTDMIKAKVLVRKNFLQFKERVLAIKSRAFQHLWKEAVHFLSKKDFHMKSQKKMDLSVRTLNRRFWKRCSSIRSRAARHRHLIANAETVEFVSKLISSTQVQPMRKALKMPALILDENEKKAARFVTTNGLVEDPWAVEKERSVLYTWTEEEKEIFMDKLSTCGKDFTKIASFFVHKTTADCIEFYYKNHKAEWFRRPEKKEKHYLTNHYLIMSETQCILEGTASSLDNLCAATLNIANSDDGTKIQQNDASEKALLTSPWKVSRDGTRLLLKRSVDVDLDDSESQTISADVLSGICGSLPPEATSPCITGAVDSRNGCHKRKTYNNKWASIRLPSTLEVSQSVGDETCSGENFDEMDYADWTDEEKSIFMQAVSSYGKDFAKLSRHIKTRTVDQCKIFFSKVHKCASLDTVCPGSANVVCTEANGAVSDAYRGRVDPGLQVFNKNSETEGYLSSSPDMKFPGEPVSNSFEQNGLSFDTGIVDSKKLLGVSTEISQVETPEQVLGVDGMGNSEMVVVPCGRTSAMPSQIKATDNIRIDNNQSDSKHVENLSSGIAVQERGLSETSMNEHYEKDNYVSPRNVSTPEHDIELKMHDSDAANIASCFHDIYENQHVDLHSNSFEKPCGGSGIVSSRQSNYPLPVKLASSGVFGAEKRGISSHEGTSFANDFEKNGCQGNGIFGQISSFNGTARKGNGDTSCKKKLVIGSGNTGFHLPHGALLQKCNGTKQNSSVPDRPVFSSENSRSYRSYNLCSQSENSSYVDKPYQGTNIKLFGHILTKPSSQRKVSQNTTRQHRNNENQNEAVKSYSGDSSSACGNSAFLEQFGGYGILQTPNFASHDESRIQTGYPSLPFSVKPLTKYPDAFRNNYYPMSSRLVQLPLQEINGGNRSLVGVLSIIPDKKIRSSSSSSTNGVFGYEMINSREVPPFAPDMLQQQQPPQEAVFPKKLRNRLELALGVQKTGRRFVGLQDSEFSDPELDLNLTMHSPQNITGWLGAGKHRIDGRGGMHGN